MVGILTAKHGFNSTMVRLKAVSIAVTFCENSFQFHYGTIKRKSASNKLVLSYGFNSTMVRLKDISPDKNGNGIMFQFHYGTIKRRGESVVVISKTTFQFHYGTIKSRGDMQGKGIHPVSIPLWYD